MPKMGEISLLLKLDKCFIIKPKSAFFCLGRGVFNMIKSNDELIG